MTRSIIVDTGPLVAVLNRRDTHHQWAVEQFKAFSPPFLTCEAVLTEASHLLHRMGFHPDTIFDLIKPGAVYPDFDLKQESNAVHALLKQYRDVPMDLADACLVRMAELHSGSRILTLDADFHIYRIHKREAVPVLMP